MSQPKTQTTLQVQPTLRAKLYLDNDYATIGYNASTDALVLIYKRQGKEEEFLRLNKRLLEINEDIRSSRCHADLRAMGVVSIKGQLYISDVVLPTLVNMTPNKTLYHSQLLDRDIFANVAATKIKSASETQLVGKGIIIVKQFKQEEEAIQWLSSCK